jgi:resolvase-like protein
MRAVYSPLGSLRLRDEPPIWSYGTVTGSKPLANRGIPSLKSPAQGKTYKLCIKISIDAPTQKMTIYGYARVSTDGQSLASQDAQLHAAGCAKMYAEKVSGARTDRPELANVLKRLRAGDVLMVVRLDRLARSTRNLLNILDGIGTSEAGFKSLGDAWADATTPHGRLLLRVLGGLAQFERELILTRTGECGFRRSRPGIPR